MNTSMKQSHAPSTHAMYVLHVLGLCYVCQVYERERERGREKQKISRNERKRHMSILMATGNSWSKKQESLRNGYLSDSDGINNELLKYASEISS